MIITCPACHTELDPSNTQCPVCLRPRSRHEMMQSLQAAKKEDEWRRKKPLYVAGAVLLVVAGGLAAVKLKRLIPTPPAQTDRPSPPAQSTAAVVTAPLSRTPQEIPTERTRPVPPPAPAPRPAPAPTPEEPPPPAEWTVSGSVYDLLTLRPAAGARLNFENRASGEVFKAKTDAGGHYRVRLPKLIEGGYWVVVSAKGYRGDYLEEASPPYTSRTRAGREDALSEASQTNILHVPIFLDKEISLEYNLALLPHE
ncbi:MAG: carboxypeptidase regulatory-like domain-containing protein [Elusimicrobia bacterium]|nr:carboxypeptidase regulatory-like domain-containing protein [Elusimicrobiota bacterium]